MDDELQDYLDMAQRIESRPAIKRNALRDRLNRHKIMMEILEGYRTEMGSGRPGAGQLPPTFLMDLTNAV